MFMLTLRKGALKKLAAVALCGVVLGGGVIGFSALSRRSEAHETAALPKEPVTKIATAQDVADFLKCYGIEPDLASAQVNAVKVPRKWDDSFKAFNEVIRESGLDMTKFKGKKVDKWMALIPALCIDEEKAYAVVLVAKETPIGAYLIKKPSGDVSGLKPASPTAALTESEIAANAGFGEGEALTVNDTADMQAAANTDSPPAEETVADAPPEEAMPTE